MNAEKIIEQLKPKNPVTIAVAAAEDDAVLSAVIMAKEQNIANAILFGDQERIEKIAKENSLNISGFEICHSDTTQQAVEDAVACVRNGKADLLMKGLLQTSQLLRAVLDKEKGLRTNKILSHIGVIASPILDRMIIVTDAAMITYPDISTKVKMVENAVFAARKLGMENPKVAHVAAVEVVNPDMPATIDAAMLTMMNKRGQIKDCVIDGPLAMDLAISAQAAAHKGVDSPVAGQADILLFHNIDVANSVAKTFTHAGNSLFGGVILGAAAPIVLTSRADSDESKLFSIVCASAISE